MIVAFLFMCGTANGADITNKSIGGILDVLGGGDPVVLTAPTIVGPIAVTTGAALDINLGTAAGDDFTVDTSAFVVEGDTGDTTVGGDLTVTGSILAPTITTPTITWKDDAGPAQVQLLSNAGFGVWSNSEDLYTTAGIAVGDATVEDATDLVDNGNMGQP